MQKNKITIKEEWSFQNRVYGFLQLVKPHRPNHDKRRLALDISFDGLGCSFILAWAFDTVSCKIILYQMLYDRSVF